MDSNFKTYDHVASFGRIDDILAQPSGNYEEVDSLPDRDKLTFTNGYYANCSALFIDIRESSKLPDIYNRPALAKLYRAYISEMVALFNSVDFAREINIVGDCVWGVYNTSTKPEIDSLFGIAAKANSLLKIFNYKMLQQSYKTPLKVGMGMAWGRALMIKAGYSGSGINDVIYMGDVVNIAAKLASKGGKYGAKSILIDSTFRYNLNDVNKGMTEITADPSCYQAEVINTAMDDWYKANCK